MASSKWEKVVFERVKKGLPHPDYVRKREDRSPSPEKPQYVNESEMEELKRKAVTQLAKAAEENSSLRKENEQLLEDLTVLRKGGQQQAEGDSTRQQKQLEQAAAQNTHLQRLLSEAHKTAREDKDSWEKKILGLQDITDDLRKRLQDYKSVNSPTATDLQRQLHSVQQKREEVEKKRDALSFELNTVKDRMQELETKLQKRSDMHRLDVEEIQHQCDQAKIVSEHHQQRYEKLSNMLDETNTMLQETRNARQNAEERWESTKLDLHTAERLGEKVKKENRNLVDHINNLNHQLSQLQNEHTSLQVTLTEVETQKKLLSGDVNTLKQTQLECQRLRSNIDDMKQQKEILTNRMQEDRRRLEAEIEETRNEKGKIHSDYRTTQQEKRHLQMQLDDAHQQNQQLGDELRVTHQRQISAETKRDTLQMDVSSLKDNLHHAESTVKDIQNTNTRLNKERDELSKKLEDTKHDLSKTKASYDQTQDELDTCKSQLAACKRDNEVLEQDLEKEKESNSNILDLQDKVDELTDKLNQGHLTLEAERKLRRSTENENNELHDTIRNIENELKESKGERDQHTLDLNNKQRQVKALEDEIDAARQRILDTLGYLADDVTNPSLAQLANILHEKCMQQAETQENLEKLTQMLEGEIEAARQSLLEALGTTSLSPSSELTKSSLGQLADMLRDKYLELQEDSDDKLSMLRDAYDKLSAELINLSERPKAAPEALFEQDVIVERHGSRTRADLLRRVGEGFKLAAKCRQFLREVRATDAAVNIKRRINNSPARDLLHAIEHCRDEIEKILLIFEEVIRNYFTPDEKKTLGMSVEFLKPLNKHKPLPLEGETVTTRTTIRSGPSPTQQRVSPTPTQDTHSSGGRISPSSSGRHSPPLPTTITTTPSPTSQPVLAGASVLGTPSPSTSPPVPASVSPTFPIPPSTAGKSMSMLQQLAASIPPTTPLSVSQVVTRGTLNE